jgi:hypothetical protein
MLIALCLIMVYRKPKHVVRFGQHNVLSEDVVVITLHVFGYSCMKAGFLTL